MKITTSISYSDSVKACHVSAELELDNQTPANVLSARTSDLLQGLQSGILRGMSGRDVLDVTPVADPNALSDENAPAPQRKQRPDDPVSPKQHKYLNDLLQANGTDLAAWCREKNISEDQITAADCQKWIPELKEKLKNKNMPF